MSDKRAENPQQGKDRPNYGLEILSGYLGISPSNIDTVEGLVEIRTTLNEAISELDERGQKVVKGIMNGEDDNEMASQLGLEPENFAKVKTAELNRLKGKLVSQDHQSLFNSTTGEFIK